MAVLEKDCEGRGDRVEKELRYDDTCVVPWPGIRCRLADIQLGNACMTGVVRFSSVL